VIKRGFAIIESAVIVLNNRFQSLYSELQGLQQLAGKHELIGDIRGKGLFYGVEIVLDRASKKPGDKEALHIREYLRDNGVLLGTTGPLDNVIKIRPPMVLSKPDADLLLDKLERALELTEL
jgi:4-aminobutyrate aminotransferase-like enzyme